MGKCITTQKFWCHEDVLMHLIGAIQMFST